MFDIQVTYLFSDVEAPERAGGQDCTLEFGGTPKPVRLMKLLTLYDSEAGLRFGVIQTADPCSCTIKFEAQNHPGQVTVSSVCNVHTWGARTPICMSGHFWVELLLCSPTDDTYL